MEIKLTTFQKIFRKICGPVFDTQRGNLRIHFNYELREDTGVTWITNYIKS